MEMKLVGTAPVDFVSKDGKRVIGTTAYMLCKSANVSGYKCEKIFIREDKGLPKDSKLNDVFDISFDIKGRLEKITKLQ